MFTKTILLALIPSLAVAAPHQRHHAGADHAQQQDSMSCIQQPNASKPAIGKAIYILTNDAEKAVVSLPIGPDRMLSKGKVMKTGGAGSVAVDAEGKPATPDALVGQSALTIAGYNLFAVNAGCNALTMMTMSSSDPILLLGASKPVAIPNEFPNTFAASTKNKLACVGTTGAVAEISCTSFSRQGFGQMDGLRPCDLGQSTPPVGPLNTVLQTFFSHDETALCTTVKGDPTVNNTGFVSTYAVQASKGTTTLSKKDVHSSPQGTAVLFGSATLPHDPSSLFVTDASFGATVLSIDSHGQATVKSAHVIDEQVATCWAIISDATNSAFVTDVGMNRVVEGSLDEASVIKQLDLYTNGDPGLIDLCAAGDFVYALSPGNGMTNAAITVLDVSGG